MKTCKTLRQPGVASRFKSIGHNQDRVPVSNPFTRINLRHNRINQVFLDLVVGVLPDPVVEGQPGVQLREMKDLLQISTT